MWVPGGMAALVGGGLVGGSSWLCRSLMDAKGPLWLRRRVEGIEGDQGALPPGLSSWSCRPEC